MRRIVNEHNGYHVRPSAPQVDEQDTFLEQYSFQSLKNFECQAFIEVDQVLGYKEEMTMADLSIKEYQEALNESVEFVMSKARSYFNLPKMEKHILGQAKRINIAEVLEANKRKPCTQEVTKLKNNNKNGVQIKEQTIYNFPDFFQDKKGSLNFIHPVNLKYLKASIDPLPDNIEVFILSNLGSSH